MITINHRLTIANEFACYFYTKKDSIHYFIYVQIYTNQINRINRLYKMNY